MYRLMSIPWDESVSFCTRPLLLNSSQSLSVSDRKGRIQPMRIAGQDEPSATDNECPIYK